MRNKFLLATFSFIALNAFAADLHPSAVKAAQKEILAGTRLYRDFGKVLFAQSFGKDGSSPAILVQQKEGWGLVSLNKDYDHFAWVYAGRISGKGPDHYWAFLDSTVEAPAPQLVMLTSDNGGNSWKVREITKPHFDFVFQSFGMDEKGHGSLILRNEAAEDGRVDYTYLTRNGGTTWTQPSKQHDATSDGRHPEQSSCSLFEEAPDDVLAKCALPAGVGSHP